MTVKCIAACTLFSWSYLSSNIRGQGILPDLVLIANCVYCLWIKFFQIDYSDHTLENLPTTKVVSEGCLQRIFKWVRQSSGNFEMFSMNSFVRLTSDLESCCQLHDPIGFQLYVCLSNSVFHFLYLPGFLLPDGTIDPLMHCFNKLMPRQNGRQFPDDIFNCIFLNENI